MSENTKDVILNGIISGIIGLIVGVVNNIISDPNHGEAFILIYSSICGIFIGTISRFLIIYLYFRKKINMKVTLFVVFITIGLITTLGSVYYYFSEQQPILIKELLVSIFIAEVLGLGFSYVSIKNEIDLNKKLDEKKRAVMRNRIKKS